MDNKLEKAERVNELTQVANQLVSLGIEELESRQEMALLNVVDVEANSKCTENSSCNTVAGCGATTTPTGPSPTGTSLPTGRA